MTPIVLSGSCVLYRKTVVIPQLVQTLLGRTEEPAVLVLLPGGITLVLLPHPAHHFFLLLTFSTGPQGLLS